MRSRCAGRVIAPSISSLLAPALRGDDNRAVDAPRAVHGRRSGVLQDVDARDVLRGETGQHRTGRPEGRDVVDHEQRLVAGEAALEAVVAADPQREGTVPQRQHFQAWYA